MLVGKCIAQLAFPLSEILVGRALPFDLLAPPASAAPTAAASEQNTVFSAELIFRRPQICSKCRNARGESMGYNRRRRSEDVDAVKFSRNTVYVKYVLLHAHTLERGDDVSILGQSDGGNVIPLILFHICDYGMNGLLDTTHSLPIRWRCRRVVGHPQPGDSNEGYHHGGHVCRDPDALAACCPGTDGDNIKGIKILKRFHNRVRYVDAAVHEPLPGLLFCHRREACNNDRPP